MYVPAEMPIRHLRFCWVFITLSNSYHWQHSRAHSHRKRGQDGSDNPADSLYCGSCSLGLPVKSSGSAVILRIRVAMQDSRPAAPELLVHSDVWDRNRSCVWIPVLMLGMSTDPNVDGEKTVAKPMHQNPSPNKPYPVLHYETLCKGRRQTMDTELVRVHTGEEIWRHNNSRCIHPTQKVDKNCELSGTPLVQWSQ